MTESYAGQTTLRLLDPLGTQALGGRVRGQQDTSRLAAGDGFSRVTKDRRKVLAYIISTGEHGATQDQVSAGILMSHPTCSARMWELRNAGLIVRTPHRRPTRSGATAAVHRATLKGREALSLSMQVAEAQRQDRGAA